MSPCLLGGKVFGGLQASFPSSEKGDQVIWSQQTSKYFPTQQARGHFCHSRKKLQCCFRCLRHDATWCFVPLLPLTARNHMVLQDIAVAHGRRPCSILPLAAETAQRATQHPATSSRNNPKRHAASCQEEWKRTKEPCSVLLQTAEMARSAVQCPATSSGNRQKCCVTSCHKRWH